MELTRDDIDHRSDDATELRPWLDAVGGRVLELGCGDGRNARALIAHANVSCVLALEVDAIAHANNLAAPPIEGLRFGLGGAESIPADDGAFDMVLLFKSLHHVPVEAMDRALAEIRRVLCPGGVAYVCEPVFAGPFSELLVPFHDESQVRLRAFEALVRAVDAGWFRLEQERFFVVARRFDAFADFEAQVIQVTHTHHDLSPEIRAEVERRFAHHRARNGGVFSAPQRVDVLRRQ